MKELLKYILFASTATFLLSGCMHYRKLITDEIVLKDGNTHTGTIRQCDTAQLKVEKPDESTLIIRWSTVDSVKGKKYKTLWVGANFGYYKAPYFSVFRNEALVAENLGFQGKIGVATRGNKLYYFNFSVLPDKPYSMNKLGLGYQRYIRKKTYLQNNCFFLGTELNLMNVKQNNGSQFTLEPFAGYEKKINERCRAHFKLGLQSNLFNKNNQTGVNLTIGIHFMKKDFKKYYEILNREHRIYKK